MDAKLKKQKRERRQKRIRAKILGSAERPRLSIFKSNRYISAQLIDDMNQITIAHSSSKGIKSKNKSSGAFEVGKNIANSAKAKKISKIVFDRSGYAYKGSVAKVAEGAREGGLEF